MVTQVNYLVMAPSGSVALASLPQGPKSLVHKLHSLVQILKPVSLEVMSSIARYQKPNLTFAHE